MRLQLKIGALLASSAIALLPNVVVAQECGAPRASSDCYGVSGGNVKDRTRNFCCSGTLGSLMQDSNGIQYILSNNHVLARSNAASVGEDISQPGMIDVNCQIREVVATLKAFPTLLGSNVDAAIATLAPGAMRNDGFIFGIGQVCSRPRNPSIGLAVKKCGRTTGVTTGTIGAINATISVQYQQGCGKGKKFTVTFTNQIVINSSTFSAGGDSGSLIVSNDAGLPPYPVGLLYAGSSSTTIANPAAEVQSKVGLALGTPLSWVGLGCAAPPEGPADPETIAAATETKDRHAPGLMRKAGVVGVGVGDDGAGGAAVVILVERALPEVLADLPVALDDFPVKVIETGEIVAY